jgi:hypothetical protein
LERTKHEFKQAFYILLDLRVAHLVRGLPWVDDEQASVHSGTTCIFTLMDGTTLEIQT